MKRITLISLGCLITLATAGQERDWQQLVNGKQFAAVIEQAQTLTSADSANYATMFAVGQAYEGMLRYREAYRCFRHCFAMDSTSNELLNTLARTAVNLGRADDAEQFYQRVLANDSTDFYANFQLGRLYQQLGDYEKSLHKFEAMLVQYPEHVVILRNIGDNLVSLGDLGQAQMVYAMAYNRNRENASLAHTLINTMLRVSAQVPSMAIDALGVCDTALYYNPGNVLLRRDKAMACFISRQYATADSIYSGLVADGDSTYITLKYGGSSRYYAGLYMDAIEPLERAYRMDTTAADVNILLGAALGRTYDRNRAHQLFDQAEDLLKPDQTLSTLLVQSRADTYRRGGRMVEAMRLYYQLWLQSKKMEYLSNMENWAFAPALKGYASADIRQRNLFISFLYLYTYLEEGGSPKRLYRYRPLLSELYEDMFFRTVTEEPLLAPDGKKSTINVTEVRRLLNLLPEKELTREEHEQLLKEEQAAAAARQAILLQKAAGKGEILPDEE